MCRFIHFTWKCKQKHESKYAQMDSFIVANRSKGNSKEKQNIQWDFHESRETWCRFPIFSSYSFDVIVVVFWPWLWLVFDWKCSVEFVSLVVDLFDVCWDNSIRRQSFQASAEFFLFFIRISYQTTNWTVIEQIWRIVNQMSTHYVMHIVYFYCQRTAYL